MQASCHAPKSQIDTKIGHKEDLIVAANSSGVPTSLGVFKGCPHYVSHIHVSNSHTPQTHVIRREEALQPPRGRFQQPRAEASPCCCSLEMM